VDTPQANTSDSRAASAARTKAGAEAPARPVSAPGTASFYRYRDADGRVVIVDSLDRVPARARNEVEHVALEAPPAPAFVLPESLGGRDLHWPSFGAGAACMLIGGLVLFGLLRSRGRFVRVLLLGSVVLLGAGAYFGWVRRTTGHEGPLLESPAALIDDARNAVQKMNERSQQQERVLRELEAEP
jgi:hypothetical protein